MVTYDTYIHAYIHIYMLLCFERTKNDVIFAIIWHTIKGEHQIFAFFLK